MVCWERGYFIYFRSGILRPKDKKISRIIFGIDALFLVNTKNSIFVMRITVMYFVNVTCTYSSILVKWVSFISGYTNISILVFL